MGESLSVDNSLADYKPSGESGLAAKSHFIALDGVRGLAIVLVLFHHAFKNNGVDPLSTMLIRLADYGWSGVDLFFVLSGFLITGILIDSRSKPHYFKFFYARRILRIFPLYYGYLIAIGSGIILFSWIMKVSIWNYIGAFTNLGYSLLYLINFKLAYDGKFSSSAFNHFWSLAVEEQFYLIWPVLVYYFSKKFMIRLCVACILVAPALRWAFHSMGLSDLGVYVLMPCRVDPLAFGALIAIVAKEPARLKMLIPSAKIIFWTGTIVLFAIVLGGYVYGRVSDNHMLSLNAIVFSSLLVMVIASPDKSILSRIFSNPALRSFGKYSYAIYVLHPLVIKGLFSKSIQSRFLDVSKTGLIGSMVYCIVGISIAYLLSIASWHLLEKHFLKLKKHYE